MVNEQLLVTKPSISIDPLGMLYFNVIAYIDNIRYNCLRFYFWHITIIFISPYIKRHTIFQNYFTILSIYIFVYFKYFCIFVYFSLLKIVLRESNICGPEKYKGGLQIFWLYGRCLQPEHFEIHLAKQVSEKPTKTKTNLDMYYKILPHHGCISSVSFFQGKKNVF